jgi:TPR repeat protein
MSAVYIGWAYRTGGGLETDLAKAEVWFRRGSESGSAIASFHLGMLFRNSNRYTEAISEFGRYSDVFPASMYRIGSMFYNGEGVAVDKIKAAALWKRASEMGHVYAKRNVAFLLIRGHFGPGKIPEGASMWFSALADLCSVYMKNPQSYLLR